VIKVWCQEGRGMALFAKGLEGGRFIGPSPAARGGGDRPVTTTPVQLGYSTAGSASALELEDGPRQDRGLKRRPAVAKTLGTSGPQCSSNSRFSPRTIARKTSPPQLVVS